MTKIIKPKELLTDYLEKTYEQTEEPLKKHSLFDKIRMVIEFLPYNSIMPGKIKHKANPEDSSNSDRD